MQGISGYRGTRVQDRGEPSFRRPWAFRKTALGIFQKADLNIPSCQSSSWKCSQAPSPHTLHTDSCRLCGSPSLLLWAALPRICHGGQSPATETRCSGSCRHAQGGCCCSRRCTGASASVCRTPGLQGGSGETLRAAGVLGSRLPTPSPEKATILAAKHHFHRSG